MVIVTGTKRSGTSMWMQILEAAGLPKIGQAFPKKWKETIAEANPQGFFESPLRRGICYQTNPHPVNGSYLPAQATRQVAVKVFIPGLCRTDLAYIDRVVASVRHWREYAASIERLYRMEDEAADQRDDRERPPPRLDPVLEWWLENYALIRNLVTRRYPAHLVTYDRVVDTPEETLPEILDWLGADDTQAAIEAVSPDSRTQRRERIDRSHPHQDTFDELYELVHDQGTLTQNFVEHLNETHQQLIPEIEKDRKRVFTARRKRRRAQQSDSSDQSSPDVLNPDALESLIHKEQ